MGRPAQPTHLKLLKGERKDRVNTREPVPSGEVMPPASLTTAARVVWERLAPDLETKGVLTAWDVDAFGAFCEAVAAADAALEHLAVQGAVIDAPVFDRNGKQTGMRRVRSPWWQIWRDSVAIAGRIGARFGMAPADRSRISVGGHDGPTPGADLLS